MSGLRILMVSPTPTHPQDAGNRARIFLLAEELRSLGNEIFFLYYGMEEADIDGMRAYWGERLVILPVQGKTLGTLKTRVKEALRGIGLGPPRGPSGVDDWYTPDLGETALRLHSREKFRVIWIEYVFISKTLSVFDSSVLKVIDTHDVFSHRFEMMTARGIKPEWFTTTPEMEKKGLARADRVVAIQDRDAAFFQTLGLPRVETIGHFVRPRAPQGPPPRNRILFIASDNSINLKTWESFTDEMLGRIEERLPDTSICVAGRICRRIPESPRYEKVGVVEDLDALYASTALAVNPATWGTGLKIKTLEPLAYGRPVVTTPVGIQGLEEAENRGILVGRTPGEFLEHIARLLTRPLFWEEQRRAAQDFLKDYLQRNRRRLSDLLDVSGLSGRKEWRHDEHE
jgi:hypothetical protein